MGKFNDLTGKKFGRLIALKYLGKSMWHCKCDCGNECDILAYNLTHNLTKSCGCLSAELASQRNFKSILGKKFGKLLVINEFKKGYRHYCTCRCDCGEELDVSYQLLVDKKRMCCDKCKPTRKKPREDLIGKRFNRLTVLEYLEQSKWRCRCDCGKEVITYGKYLKSGKVKSCGCFRNEQSRKKLIDLTGKKFGRLLVQYQNGRTSDNKVLWHCKCDCGNEVDKQSAYLLSGGVKSCGCLRSINNGMLKNLIGYKFGKLTVKDRVGSDSDGHALWLCLCDCGNEKVVTAQHLINGTTRSCGCLNVGIVGSQCENEIKDYIEFISNLIPKKSRILDGKEIDMYYDTNNIGIEYNGSDYHASVNGLFSNKPRNYHRDKFLLAKEKGIHLINIFDVDWESNQGKIKMYLKSLFTNNNKLYARDCIVSEIGIKEANNFCDMYHLQGSSKFSSVCYGLFYNNELLSIMCFGKVRMSSNKDGHYELHRYCVKDGYTIVGGANKLLKHFELTYKPKYLRSYSDNDFFSGSIYSKLGFNEVGQANQRYYWVLNKHEFKRESCQIKYLKRDYPVLYDEAINNDASNIEDYIMVKLGARKVYRSGNTRWEKYYSSR